MSVKDKFSKEEWLKIMNGPSRAGAAIVAASPSGITGLIAEAQAIAHSVRGNVSKEGRSALMEAMAADLLGTPPQPDEHMKNDDQVKNMEEAKNKSIEGVRQAMWLVKSKLSPDETSDYQKMLIQVVEKTAEAAKEGGFLGIGGEQVNDKERAVMDELRQLILG